MVRGRGGSGVLMPYVEGKKCCKCLNILPYDAFSVPGKKVHTCKSCEGHLELKAAHEEKREAETWAISRIMDSVNQGYEVPDIEHYLYELYDAFGGPKGVASKFLGVFTAAKAGSMIQARILEHIGKIQVKASQQKQEMDLATLSREELDFNARDLLARYVKTLDAELRPVIQNTEPQFPLGRPGLGLEPATDRGGAEEDAGSDCGTGSGGSEPLPGEA